MNTQSSRAIGYLPTQAINISVVGKASKNGEPVAVLDVTGAKLTNIGQGVVQNATGCLAVGVNSGLVHESHITMNLTSQQGSYQLVTDYRIQQVGNVTVSDPSWLPIARKTVNGTIANYEYQSGYFGNNRTGVFLYRPEDADKLPSESAIHLVGENSNLSTRLPPSESYEYIGISKRGSDTIAVRFNRGGFTPEQVPTILANTNLTERDFVGESTAGPFDAPLEVRVTNGSGVLYNTTITEDDYIPLPEGT
jgi:hypothetical protein